MNSFSNSESISISISPNIPKLCLNMIVKNESKIILRLLESVEHIIDGYCICDTGSTDNTIEIIEDFFKNRKIYGKIIQEPFRDFGYNRSFATNACKDIPNMDYLLLLDADMILTGDSIKPENAIQFKSRLIEDCYYVFQGSHQYYYKNVRIMKNYCGYSYWGVTHEYINTPNGTKYGQIPIHSIFINDIGDGGAKIDKFERDIKLLIKGLEDNPNNDRYTFYLANSYRDAGNLEMAIIFFRKRIVIGGWIEEVWNSHYNIGNCYKSLGQMENAIFAWMEAFQVYPKRIESLYEIIHYYREQGKNELAYLFYKSADSSRTKWEISNDYLFLQKDVYDYKLDYEMSIIGYYVNYDNFPMSNICMNILNYTYLPNDIKINVMSNYKFYKPQLIDLIITPFNQPFMTTATDSLKLANDTFVKSTPSLILNGDNLIINIRYVNYKIDDYGNYINQSHIISKNAISVLNISEPIWKVIQEFELTYDNTHDGSYIGLEDIRLMIHNNSIIYNANRGIENKITVEHGKISLIDKSTTCSGYPKIINHHNIEKNWVLLPGNEIKIIYNWNPDLIIGVFQKSILEQDYTFIETHRIPVPLFLKDLRGSTNGVVIHNDIWLICHTVSYEDRRYYYHIIIVLDKDSYQIKRYTTFFTFEGAQVEYTLGFVYLENSDELLIGYSLYDKCSKYMLVGRNQLENMMIQK